MSRTTTVRRRRRSKGKARNKLLVFFALLLALASIGIASAVGYVVSIANDAPSLQSLQPSTPGRLSRIYAADGTRLGFIQADELRQPVAGRLLPEVLKDATVAIEDERFYKHGGVDYNGVIRAAVRNLESGKTVEGGSTISMQLVRNLYRSASRERTYKRKIQEAKLAEELEEEHSKPWILNSYLNVIPYGTAGGQTAIGAQAASRMYFGKSVEKLTLAEAALLAGLPQAPSSYSPFRFPSRALARRNEVLRAMVKQKLITAQEGAEAEQAELGVGKQQTNFYAARRESYFFDYVKDELIKKYGAREIREGGLQIFTTIDLRKQREARAAISSTLNQSGDPSSAIVTLDPDTGYIRAMASSADYGKSKFNLAAQGHRQPGSTFKVMALMAALREGVDPDRTSYVSKPLNLPNTPYGPIKTKTYDNTYGGSMSLTKATLKSDNSVYMQLALDIGPKEVAKTARDMGIKSKLFGFPAESLGGLKYGVSPLEMANAYATIASGGERHRPIAVRKVVFPDGKTERPFKIRRVRVFDPSVTDKATDILKRNVEGGTGTKAQTGCPTAGKTGTTDNFNDAWFVGFTPKLATAVWMGYPNAQIEMRSVHGISVAGGTFPAEIWGKYMKTAKGGYCGDFEKSGKPFDAQPFFGRYSKTGSSDDDDYDSYGDQPDDYPPPPGDDAPSGDEPGNGVDNGGKRDKDDNRGDTFKPDLYEAPPQDPPDAAPPTGGATPGNGDDRR